MPEAPEVYTMSRYVSSVMVNNEVIRVEKSPTHKCEDIQIDEKMIMYSICRGKEMCLVLSKPNDVDKLIIRMTMGMTGHFRRTRVHDPLPKHAHLIFYLDDDTVLSFVDPRRFGKWKVVEHPWSKNRGASPMYDDKTIFTSHVIDTCSLVKYKDVAMCDLLMSQRCFNGIGNYLRAEILYKANVNPFVTMNEIDCDDFAKIITLCINLCQESYQLGAGQLKDWKNPENENPLRFNDWLECYGKLESMIDLNGRRLWFDKKWITTNEYLLYSQKLLIQHTEKHLRRINKLFKQSQL